MFQMPGVYFFGDLSAGKINLRSSTHRLSFRLARQQATKCVCGKRELETQRVTFPYVSPLSRMTLIVLRRRSVLHGLLFTHERLSLQAWLINIAMPKIAVAGVRDLRIKTEEVQKKVRRFVPRDLEFVVPPLPCHVLLMLSS